MQDQHTLKPETILGRYKIIHVLGEGGFGITYLAEDLKLGVHVAIKEYFPNEFVIRSSDSTVKAKSKSVNDFTKGIQRFKEEAQILAKFSHPSIVKVLGYFEANKTAYFVMDYEEGIDLSKYLKQKCEPLSQEEVIGIVMPILEGLKEVHRYDYLHRDIKPGNILLRSNNSPVIIDFGAARIAVNNEQSVSVTSMLTDGYAPFEQYSTDIKQQGPFTDIYGMAAVMYKMITMETPISSQTRSYKLLQNNNDPLIKLSVMNLKGYEFHFLKSIDKALEIKAKNRQQTVDEFQANLLKKRTVESHIVGLNLIKKISMQIYNNIWYKNSIFFLSIIGVIFSLYYGISQYVVFLDNKGIHEKELLRSSLIIDNRMWQDMPENKMRTLTWDKATTYCHNLVLGGFEDWELPNVDELKELHLRKYQLNYVTSDFYWSSSFGVPDENNAWYVYSKGGEVFWGDKNSKFYLRCMRNY